MDDDDAEAERQAKADYIRTYRSNHPDYVDRANRAAAARLAALRKVAAAHPREFAMAFAVERIKRGLPAEPGHGGRISR